MTSLISRMCHLRSILMHLILFNVIFAIPIENKSKAISDICPRIISRSEWKARNASYTHENLRTVPTPYVVIHHGGILHYCYDEIGCSEIVRSYQNLHMDTNKWIDIGYNFVIGEDGNVYEGRGWDFRGAHAPGYNTQSIGVSIIGDFSHFIPNKSALKALEALIACGVSMKKISKTHGIIGHRQGRNTVCPGEVFFNYVMTMPNWTSKPIPDYNITKPNVPMNNSQLPSNVVDNKVITVL